MSYLDRWRSREGASDYGYGSWLDDYDSKEYKKPRYWWEDEEDEAVAPAIDNPLTGYWMNDDAVGKIEHEELSTPVTDPEGDESFSKKSYKSMGFGAWGWGQNKGEKRLRRALVPAAKCIHLTGVVPGDTIVTFDDRVDRNVSSTICLSDRLAIGGQFDALIGQAMTAGRIRSSAHWSDFFNNRSRASRTLQGGALVFEAGASIHRRSSAYGRYVDRAILETVGDADAIVEATSEHPTQATAVKFMSSALSSGVFPENAGPYEILLDHWEKLLDVPTSDQANKVWQFIQDNFEHDPDDDPDSEGEGEGEGEDEGENQKGKPSGTNGVEELTGTQKNSSSGKSKDPVADCVRLSEASRDPHIRPLKIVPESGVNKQQYEAIVAKNIGSINALRGALDFRLVDAYADEFCKRSGSLYAGDLARSQYSEHIFSRRDELTLPEVNAYLLIDESGSMSGNSIEQAKAVSAVLMEALEEVPGVSVRILGYTDDKIRDYGADKYSIPSMAGRGGTPTASAINAVTKVLAAEDGDRLLFVITDGGSCEGPASCSRQCKDALRHGVQVIGFGVGVDQPRMDEEFGTGNSLAIKSISQAIVHIARIINIKAQKVMDQ